MANHFDSPVAWSTMRMAGLPTTIEVFEGVSGAAIIKRVVGDNPEHKHSLTWVSLDRTPWEWAALNMSGRKDWFFATDADRERTIEAYTRMNGGQPPAALVERAAIVPGDAGQAA